MYKKLPAVVVSCASSQRALVSPVTAAAPTAPCAVTSKIEAGTAANSLLVPASAAYSNNAEIGAPRPVAQAVKPLRNFTDAVSGIQLSRRSASVGGIDGSASRMFQPPTGGGIDCGCASERYGCSSWAGERRGAANR